jgi:hypothetical protein
MRSDTSSRLLPEPFTFFIDRSIGGRIVAGALQAQGELVEAHDAHFDKKAPDVEWLATVGSRGWVVISKDDRIRLNELERQALIAADVAAFILGRSDLTGPQMAKIVVTALSAMKRALRRFPPPLIARISARGEVSVFETKTERFSPPRRIAP